MMKVLWGKRSSGRRALGPAAAFNEWAQQRNARRPLPQRLAEAAARQAEITQAKHDKFLLRSLARRSKLLEDTVEHSSGRPVQYFQKTGKYAYPLSRVRLTRHSPGEIVVPEGSDPAEYVELTENRPRATRDKPKKAPQTRVQPNRAPVTPEVKEERRKEARAKYIKRKQDERRKDVIDFITAMEITGFDADGVDVNLPFVEGWMFPIVIPIGTRNISFKTKTAFLSRYVWTAETSDLAPEVRYSQTARMRKQTSKRGRIGKEAMGAWSLNDELNGRNGEETGMDGVNQYGQSVADEIGAIYDFTYGASPTFLARIDDAIGTFVARVQISINDPVTTAMDPSAYAIATATSTGVNVSHGSTPGGAVDAFYSYLAAGRSSSLHFPDYGIVAGVSFTPSNGVHAQVSAGAAQFAAFMDWLSTFATYIPSGASPASIAFLNGINGEWTNTDDVKGKAKAGKMRKARVQVRVLKRTTPKPRAPRAGVALSHCATKYARAIAAPFSPDAFGACVPVFPSPDSQKLHSLRRAFNFSVGSSGVGGIFIAPCASNQQYNVVGTTSTYTGNTLALPAALDATVIAGQASTLPYGNADFGAGELGVRARIVSVGIRIKYVGTQLNMGGSIAGFFDPNHTTIGNNTYDLGDITNLPYASYESVDRRMNFALQTAAVSAHDVQFQDRGYCYSPSASVDYAGFKTAAIGAVIVTGEPGNVFELEMITHVEYIGAPASAALTKTHTDARGFEMVQQASGQLASETANNRQSTWAVMTRLLGQAARDLAPHVIGAGVRAARSRLAGPRPMLTIQDF